MNKPNVIIHPYSFNQSDWVRLFLPFMQFMRANEFQVIPSFSTLPCLNKDYLKQTRAVILQKSNAPGRAQLALAYSNLKKECGFKLITDIDDLMWDLSPVIATYAKKIPNHDQMMVSSLKQVLPLFDKVICSTRYLAQRIKTDIGINTIVMPNGVSRSLYGFHKTTVAFTGKPKVMYAGNLGHYTEEITGDFEGPWIDWIRKHIEDSSIDFIIFGEPHFLKDLEGKYTKLPYTTSMEYPSTAVAHRPDFYLAPLANNNFNKAKSDLKLKEAAALGAVFIGSDFAGSPYSYAPREQLVGQNDTVEKLDEIFKNLCEPANYMKAIEWQYQAMEEKHWLYEDPEFQKKFIATYCSEI